MITYGLMEFLCVTRFYRAILFILFSRYMANSILIPANEGFVSDFF